MPKGDYDSYLIGRSLRGAPSRRWANASKRELADVPTKREDLQHFAEESNSPVAARLWNDRLIGYSKQGEIEIDADKVKTAAAAVDRRGVTAREYGEEVSGVKYAGAARGQELTDSQAIGILDRDYQTRAAAILLAADLGKVKLTDAQRANLKAQRDGKYSDFVNAPTKADKDKDGHVSGRNRDDGRYDANRREFIENVASQRGAARKKRKAIPVKPVYKSWPDVGLSDTSWLEGARDEAAR